MKTEDFASLFAGRTDIWFDCLTDRRGLGDLRPELWEQHLNGDQPIGVYNLCPDSTVSWSATDIDVDEPEWVERIVRTWDFYGIKAWPETSRSKGWHVWIFHPEPIQALTARNAWLWVHDVCDVPPTEVYPKQVDGTNTFGNCIRLPLNPLRSDGRQTFYLGDLTTEIEPETWIQRAVWERESPAGGRRKPTQDVMAGIASNYEFETKDTAEHKGVVQHTNGGNDQDIAAVYNGTARVVEGQRDNTFWTLACFAAGRGHSADEIETIIESVYNKQTDLPGYPLEAALAKIDRALQLVQRKRETG